MHVKDLAPEELEALLAAECNAVREMLLAKNRAYGNSALDPVRVFSKAPTAEQIRVRLDDKLSRLARGSAAGEDVELDLVGYIMLLRVHRLIESSERVDIEYLLKGPQQLDIKQPVVTTGHAARAERGVKAARKGARR